MTNSGSIHPPITLDLNSLEKTETPGASVPIGGELGKLLNDSLEKLYQRYAQENPKKSIEMLVRFIKTYDINPSSIDLSFYCLEALKLYHNNPQLIQENHEDFLTILSRYLSKNSMIIKDENIDLILEMCKVATEKYNNVISNVGSKYANIGIAYGYYKKIYESKMKEHISKQSEGGREPDTSNHYLENLRVFRNSNHIKEGYPTNFLWSLKKYLEGVGNICNIETSNFDFIYEICKYACKEYYSGVNLKSEYKIIHDTQLIMVSCKAFLNNLKEELERLNLGSLEDVNKINELIENCTIACKLRNLVYPESEYGIIYDSLETLLLKKSLVENGKRYNNP